MAITFERNEIELKNHLPSSKDLNNTTETPCIENKFVTIELDLNICMHLYISIKMYSN